MEATWVGHCHSSNLRESRRLSASNSAANFMIRSERSVSDLCRFRNVEMTVEDGRVGDVLGALHGELQIRLLVCDV